MPKVTMPLLALTATGTLGGALTYCIHPDHQRVRFHHKRTLTRTPLQILHGARVAESRTAWRTLAPATADAWRARAVFEHLTGPALFMREWFGQMIYSPDLPMLPV